MRNVASVVVAVGVAVVVVVVLAVIVLVVYRNRRIQRTTPKAMYIYPAGVTRRYAVKKK